MGRLEELAGGEAVARIFFMRDRQRKRKKSEINATKTHLLLYFILFTSPEGIGINRRKEAW